MTSFNPISTLQLSLQGRKLVSDLTHQVTEKNQELSTGFRKNVFADLGARSAQSLEFRNRMGRTENFVVTNEMLGGKLEMIEDAMTGVRDSVQDLLNVAVGSADSPNQLASELQNQANATLNFVLAGLNLAYGGEYLMSGVATDTKPMQDIYTANPATGRSPADVIDGIVGAGPVTAADATAFIAQLDAVFDSTAADPLDDFEATFFNGTPLQDTLGNPNPRATAQIDDEIRINYGVQANDPAVRSMLKGIFMFASVDVTTITDPAAYETWASEAVDSIVSGLQGFDDARVTIGSHRKLVEDTVTAQQSRMDIFNARILNLEAVDPYETAAWLQNLQGQLEATYATTAKIGRMSFLNYM